MLIKRLLNADDAVNWEDFKMIVIENDFLTVTAENLGAELNSIRSNKTGTEYLFNGDKKYWGYHAPILFPIVCGLVDKKFRHNGNEYSLPNHGFARISTFKTIEHTENKIVFELRESEETLRAYPFKFILKITYVLNKNTIDTIMEVENPADTELYFSIGGHPALSCPFNGNEMFEDYYLEFSEPENATRMFCSENHMSRRQEPYLVNESAIGLDYSMFINDTLVLKNLRSEKVMLKSKKSESYVSFSIKDFPYVAFWTKPDAPFICIEPWYGHDDFDDFAGELKDKAGIVKLEKGGKFKCNYCIEVHE